VDIFISNTSSHPIYQQIYEQLRNLILSGGLSEGELLPSIRTLAKDLRISVITTKRAYDELEKDGYIHTVAGKGCYVAPKNTEQVKAEHCRRIEEHLRAVLLLAPACGLTADEITAWIKQLQKEEQGCPTPSK
jgi:GntR family transcriptional regulator